MRAAVILALFLVGAWTSHLPAQSPYYQGNRSKSSLVSPPAAFTTVGPGYYRATCPSTFPAIRASSCKTCRAPGPSSRRAGPCAGIAPRLQSLKDPELLAEAHKQRMDVDPESGENLEKLAKRILEQPPEVIARVKKVLGN